MNKISFFYPLVFALTAFGSAQAATYTVTNVNNTGAGSLRQAILNANANAGADIIAFNIPVGLLTGGVAKITITSALPAITGAVTIDGTTQTTNVGNTNNIMLGTGGTVGVGLDGIPNSGDEVVLAQLNAPEIEIIGNSTIDGLEIKTSSVTIKGLCIRSFASNIWLNPTTGVTLTNVIIDGNLLGTSATSFSDLGVGLRSTSCIATVGSFGISNMIVRNNLMGYCLGRALYLSQTSPYMNSGMLIENNEIRNSGLDNSGSGGNCEILDNFSNFTFQKNLSNGSAKDQGLELRLGTSTSGNGTSVIEHNTFSDNGESGINIYGSQGGKVGRINYNLVYNNGYRLNFLDDIYAVSIATPSSFSISRNSMYGNAANGIDLYDYPAVVTPNDGVYTAGTANGYIDYPIILPAYTLSGNNLTLSGYIGSNVAGTTTFANTTVEIYAADNTPANESGEVVLGDGLNIAHGEGRVYLGSLTANANSLFSGTLALSASQIAAWTAFLGRAPISGDKLTATTTDASSRTSEFGPMYSLEVCGNLIDDDSDGLVDETCPDFTPTVDIDIVTFINGSAARDFLVNISEVNNAASLGQVVLKIPKISGFDYTFSPTMTNANIYGGTAVNNSLWDMTQNSLFITMTLKPGVVLSPYGIYKIGMTVMRKTSVPTQTNQPVTVTIVDGSGSDLNRFNNTYNVIIKAQ